MYNHSGFSVFCHKAENDENVYQFDRKVAYDAFSKVA